MSLLPIKNNNQIDLKKSSFTCLSSIVVVKLYSNLYNFSHDVYTEEELLDTMERLNCRIQMHPLNVYGVVLELVKQELIQKPYIMVCSWKRLLKNLLKRYDEFKSFETVQKFYRDFEPTAKKVLPLLKADPKSDYERECLRYLQRYIHGLDKAFLLKFLRFVTGTNIVSNIFILSVSFIKMQDLQRRPIAHTCGPLLKISDTYRNFCELREKFQHVLKANTWTFDTS